MRDTEREKLAKKPQENLLKEVTFSSVDRVKPLTLHKHKPSVFEEIFPKQNKSKRVLANYSTIQELGLGELKNLSIFLSSIMSNKEWKALGEADEMWDRTERREKYIKAYPEEYIQSTVVGVLGDKSFVFNKKDLVHLEREHQAVFQALSEMKNLVNPVYIDFEDGKIIVD